MDSAARRRAEAGLLHLVRPVVAVPVPDVQIDQGPPLFGWHRLWKWAMAKPDDSAAKGANCQVWRQGWGSYVSGER